MTAEIIKKIKLADREAIHSIYVAIHQAHKTAPGFFTIAHCNTIITALMGCQPWSWSVDGITPAALQKYKELGFTHKSGQGLTRAHLRPRISTVRELLACQEPLSQVALFET